jgi:hypothetical protein
MSDSFKQLIETAQDADGLQPEGKLPRQHMADIANMAGSLALDALAVTARFTGIRFLAKRLLENDSGTEAHP